MHPTLKRALERANELLDEALSNNVAKADRKKALAQMSKKQLIEIIAGHEKLDQYDVQVGELCSSILCDAECVWLSYDMINALLHSRIPGLETKPHNVAWYASHYRNEKDRDVQLRKPQAEITRLLMKG
jgi:hypothetical protein